MARKDWINVGIHSELVKAIDMFLERGDAISLDLHSRQDFVNKLIRQFFAKYHETTGVYLLKVNPKDSLFDLIAPKRKKIKNL